MNRKQKGSFYEEAAVAYLENNGVIIVERNYFCKMGEIDIIGIDGDTLVFFEVKFRESDVYGHALEAVDRKKQSKIIKVANYYLAYKRSDKYIRFDVIGIQNKNIEWIKSAFCM